MPHSIVLIMTQGKRTKSENKLEGVTDERKESEWWKRWKEGEREWRKEKECERKKRRKMYVNVE